MLLIILTLLFVGAMAAPMQQSMSVNEDGSYQFFYETGDEGGKHSRTEVRQPDGVIIGKYSYEDANGELREVNYRADDSGYVANGDVSVEGAPKGKFPADPEIQYHESSSATPLPEEVKPEPEAATPAEPLPQENSEPHQDQEPKEDDIRDLSLDEPTANDPPEAFPPGFFLHQFQGLRRLPEPTKEEPPTTPEPVVEEVKDTSSAVQDSDQHVEPTASEIPNDDLNKVDEKANGDMQMFMHLRPFQSFSPQRVGSSMFRQPMHVFSYHHPDSYGYQYFF